MGAQGDTAKCKNCGKLIEYIGGGRWKHRNSGQEPCSSGWSWAEPE